MYESENIEIPLTLNDIDELYNHPVLKPYIDIYKMKWLRKTDEEKLRNFLAHTYGTISQIDDGIGKILSALKSFGLENETLIIFTSDHGDLMGDHGVLFQGMAHYQGYIKVPLIFQAPKLINEGIITNSLASSIDLPLTILNLLGIKSKNHPPGIQGYDLTPILKNPHVEVRDQCIIEEDQDPQKDSHKLPPIRVRTMITERYRITVYQGHEEFGDLYDLKNDPHEKHNLWYDENSRKIKNKLITKLLHELINIQDRFPKRQARA